MSEGAVSAAEAAAKGQPSALHKCLRCNGYFTFNTDTMAPSTPCRFHPSKYSVFGGSTGGTLQYSCLPPYWRCCGSSRHDAPGCKQLPSHVQDERFMDTTMQFSLIDRDQAVADWPPAVAEDASGSVGSQDCSNPKPTAKDWVEVRVTKDDTVAKLAVRYGCDPVLLRALNRLPNDMMLMSRSTVLVPPHDPEVTPPPPPLTEDEIRKRKLQELMRVGRTTLEEARYYLAAADDNVAAALNELRGDLEWEETHPPPASSTGEQRAARKGGRRRSGREGKEPAVQEPAAPAIDQLCTLKQPLLQS